MATPEDILILKQLWEQNLVSYNSLDAPLKNFCKELLKGKSTSLGEILIRSGLVSAKEIQTLQENSRKTLQEIAPEIFNNKVWNIKAEDCKNLVKMGDSALGNTYSASHPDVECVIKYIEGIIANNRIFLKRFFVQLEKLSKLQHENIATIYNVSHSKLQIIREYIPGKNLNEYIADNEVSLFEACIIISSIAKGLHFAHQNNILHKNLKPSNIIVTEDQDIKIVDFSLPPTVPNYLSPEQCLKQKSDVRADIYSLGLIFYFILTNEPAIKETSTKDIMSKITSGNFLQTISERNDIPEEINDILQKMLAINPDTRYSEYLELIKDLDQYKSDSKINIRRSFDDNMMHTAEIALSAEEKNSLMLDITDDPMMALEAEDIENEDTENENIEDKDEPMHALAIDEDSDDNDMEDNDDDIHNEIVISDRPIPQLSAEQVKNAPEQKVFDLEDPSEEEEEEESRPEEEGKHILFKKTNKLKPYFLRNKDED